MIKLTSVLSAKVVIIKMLAILRNVYSVIPIIKDAYNAKTLILVPNA